MKKTAFEEFKKLLAESDDDIDVAKVAYAFDVESLDAGIHYSNDFFLRVACILYRIGKGSNIGPYGSFSKEEKTAELFGRKALYNSKLIKPEKKDDHYFKVDLNGPFKLTKEGQRFLEELEKENLYENIEKKRLAELATV